MVFEPIDYSASGGRAMLTGLQAAGTLQDIGIRNAAIQQQQAQQQAQQAFQKDWQLAWGDPKKMSALMGAYPAQFEMIKNGIGFQDDTHRNAIGNLARDLRIAEATGNPQAVATVAQGNAELLGSMGSSPQELMQMDPQQRAQLTAIVGMSALGAKDFFGVQNDQAQREIDRDKLAEVIRSNQAGEGLQAQQIAVSRENARRAAGGSTPASVREYQYFNSLSPEQQKTYLRVRGRPTAGGDNTVQLADGRTVSVSGKLHGSGANAFYEGTDDAGNMVRVPASAISAPPTSTASAQSYAMKKDIDSITNADSNQLDFMTGVTGSTGSSAYGADVRSRLPGNKDQRQLYNATRRIQGRMQNQGIAAAKDMGASGINTIPEARMYFQSMPQLDYSSPEAMQQSLRDIQEYTDRVNKEHQINIGGKRQAVNQQTLPQQYGQTQAQAQQAAQQPAAQPQASFSSLWGE